MSSQAHFRSELHRVTAFETVVDYTLRLTFDDGTERVIDFEPILCGPVFEPLRDLTVFRQVQLDDAFGALKWPTGADIDPTVLHDWPEHLEHMIERRRKQFAVGVHSGEALSQEDHLCLVRGGNP